MDKSTFICFSSYEGSTGSLVTNDLAGSRPACAAGLKRQPLSNPPLSKIEGDKMKTPGWICFRRRLPPGIHGRVLPHSEAESIGANSRMGASAERREADFPSALSAGHQLQTKAKR
jgi:hypothetical protein